MSFDITALPRDCSKEWWRAISRSMRCSERAFLELGTVEYSTFNGELILTNDDPVFKRMEELYEGLYP